jgi:hypothetical protein
VRIELVGEYHVKIGGLTVKKEFHSPSIEQTAFDCPHCGAFTSQEWFKLHASKLDGEQRVPNIPNGERRRQFESDNEIPEQVKVMILEWVDRMRGGLVFFDRGHEEVRSHLAVENLFLGQCYNCKKISVWVHERLVFPPQGCGVLPHSDLPPEIVADFEEARRILELSPRGSAALLRLCVQKLCVVIGEKGRNIDEDIGNLVKKGLNPIIQKALDVVRVIGNEAVHPGVLDLRDDRATEAQLFEIINIIAEQMLGGPKKVQSMYDSLPIEKRNAIDARNERMGAPDSRTTGPAV